MADLSQLSDQQLLDLYKKAKSVQPKEKASQGNALAANSDAFRRAQDSMKAIDDAKRRATWDNTGFIGNELRKFGGSNAYNYDRDMNTLRARIAFDEMKALRAASPTGATGLGSTTESEMKLLQEAESSLDIGQSKEQLTKNLDRFRGTIVSRNPGLTADNPIIYTSEDQFPSIPIGAYFKDPTGKVWKKAAPNSAPKGGGNDVLAQARAAIKSGAAREAVIQRLRENGINPAGL